MVSVLCRRLQIIVFDMTQGGFGRLFYWGSCESPLFAVPGAAGGVCELSGWAPFAKCADWYGNALLRQWESSSLGGCEVGCSGVCVETPATGTMGPIYSSGVECSMGGGGGGDGDGGGDTGGSPGGDGSLPGDTDNIAGWQYFNHYGYETVGYTLSKINTNLGKQLTGVNSRLSDLKSFSNQIAGNTFKTQLELSGVNDRLNEALPYIKETSGRIEGTNLYLSRMEADFDLANAQLKKIADNIGSLDGGGSGGSDLGTLPGDAAAIKGMMQTAMGWWAALQGI